MTVLALSRDGVLDDGQLYAGLSAAERYIHQTRDGAFRALLHRHSIDSLAGLRILEIGCGEGALVRTLIHYGADLKLIHGIDVARAGLLGLPISASNADAAHIPYRDGSFDLAFSFTALSSMQNSDVQQRAVRETLRTLKPGGMLVIYDFRLNPTNAGATPIAERALRSFVPDHKIDVQRVTLAPPLVLLLRGAPALCQPLELLPWLRTHLLAAITKETE